MKRVRDIRDQLLGLCDRVEIELTSKLGDVEAIKKAITAGKPSGHLVWQASRGDASVLTVNKAAPARLMGYQGHWLFNVSGQGGQWGGSLEHDRASSAARQGHAQGYRKVNLGS